MRCNRCGKELVNRVYKYNTTILCDDCARELGLPDPLAMANNAMRLFNEEMIFPQSFGELEFSPTKSQIKCPKCGTSLRDFEQTGMLGCIECYNTFNESIMRMLMRSQANTRYAGRAPGNLPDPSKINGSDEVAASSEIPVSETPETSSKKQADDEEKLTRYENSDLGMLSDDDLREAIKLAVAKENYMLAARFRDELKGREEKV